MKYRVSLYRSRDCDGVYHDRKATHVVEANGLYEAWLTAFPRTPSGWVTIRQVGANPK